MCQFEYQGGYLTLSMYMYAGLLLSCAMLRLRALACELSPAVVECILCRHSGSAHRLCYAAQVRHCQVTSAKSAVSSATDGECKPIKKLLVANRGRIEDVVT